MDIYFTRHGQTDWNLEKRAQGKADTELNDEGIIQAETVKQKLNNEKIDLILCSPLKRARQTADIINRGRNIPIIYDERISERDFGEFEGKIMRIGFNYEDFWNYKKNITYKRAENIIDFFDRIFTFLDSIKEEYNGKSILLVTHGGVSIPVICYFNGIPQDGELSKLAIENCEVLQYHL